MEKRFISFLLIALVVLVGYSFLMQAVFGPAPQLADAEAKNALVAEDPDAEDTNPEDANPEDTDAEGLGAKGADVEGAAAKGGNADDATPANLDQDAATAKDSSQESNAEESEESDDQPNADDQQDERAKLPLQLQTLGSLDPESPYQMLLIVSNQGAAIQSVELTNPRYGELNRKFGYLGNLGLAEQQEEGCRVQVVGPGTPAAAASASGVQGGLRGPTFDTKDGALTAPGDLITSLNGSPVRSISDYRAALQDTRVGVETKIGVIRIDEQGREKEIEFTATPSKAPLSMLRVEPWIASEEEPQHQGSFLVSLNQIGTEKTRFKEDEIKGLPSLREAMWSVSSVKGNSELGPGVEFRTTLTAAALKKLNLEGAFEVVKTYRLAKVPKDDPDERRSSGYRVEMDVEFINRGDATQKIAYQIDGPTGITTEGWWYSYKTHPKKFVSAGARDVAWRVEDGRHQLYVCSDVTKAAKEEEESNTVPMTDAGDGVRMRYAGCDTQYFAAVMMPRQATDTDKPTISDEFDTAVAMAVGPLDEKLKRTDVTFRLRSRLFSVEPNDSLKRSYDLYLGPKDKHVLEKFKLEDFIVYGWFGWVSRPMLWILHGLYWLTGKFSYGLAIVLLTVMVRGCMFPLGRKMARNAQKMQELAPEMKKIADKYKNDMEKRAAAQKELFTKHKYNPLSGCGVMFVQMPVFLGLYRGLSCDIELRQAPLIPGISWCSNLAGPDMFWNWQGIAPDFLTTPIGLFGLGPYLNILPLCTVVLFIAQQKLFTPPPQDEQQAMQHTIMKFMMVFMGFIFHKVAAGLCLYIIVSTLWGLGERLLLPKPGQKTGAALEPVAAVAGVSGGGAGGKNSGGSRNGSSGSSKKKKNKRR